MGIKNVFEITVIFVMFIAFFIWILFTLNSIRLNNRIKNQTVKLKKEVSESWLDKLIDWYNLEKEKYIKKYFKNKTSKQNQSKAYLSSVFDKTLSMVITVIVYLLLSLFYLNIPSMLEIVTVMIIGYLIPTFTEMVKLEYNKKLIKKELLKSIMLINNGLAGGKTIKESIKVTTKKLDGPLKLEFERVINDLDHGLSIENAFKRVEKRTKVKDILYLTTSLSILGKTGGNIVEVFSYLETVFKTRKKLELELSSTIASSKLVFIILSVLPLLMIVGMNLFYDNYLIQFINNPLGNLLGILIVIIYLTYLVFITKLIKIEDY